MPIILSIETSTGLASAALLQDNAVLAREATGVNTHSQTILPLVQSLLAQAGIPLSRCDAIAFGSGPGSFTGVRTACGIAQGLAFGADLPLVPIVTLEAMAHACRAKTGAAEVLAVLDARMGEVYWAQYRHDGEFWQVVSAPALSAPAMVRPDGPVIACGNGLAAYASAFDPVILQDMQPDVMPHAACIAQLATIAFARGGAVAARDAQPLYLRNKVALTTQERAAKVSV